MIEMLPKKCIRHRTIDFELVEIFALSSSLGKSVLLKHLEIFFFSACALCYLINFSFLSLYFLLWKNIVHTLLFSVFAREEHHGWSEKNTIMNRKWIPFWQEKNTSPKREKYYIEKCLLEKDISFLCFILLVYFLYSVYFSVLLGAILKMDTG